MEYKIIPAVDAVREFLEISSDFTNPLEVVREAISNSMDAGASRIELSFTQPSERGSRLLTIKIVDDGEGMGRSELQSFFDLGNSLKRGNAKKIGEKGHGTKVYFNCNSIAVETHKNSVKLKAEMQQPYLSLQDGELPTAIVTQEITEDEGTGTTIIIKGFNNNEAELFTHDRLKDYIIWFTKFGSWELLLNQGCHKNKIIILKGLDKNEPEEISFGHIFPNESKKIEDLFEEYVVKAPDFYCRRVVRSGNLRRFPAISFDVVFSIEGNKVKQSYNKMLRRPGYSAPTGAYTVQDRYGIWLTKDFIPIERKNDWISTKGSEFTKFHAFVNCQDLSLTANRGSTANTERAILDDLEAEVKKIYEDIITGDEWREIDWLETEAGAYLTSEKEKKDFSWRQDRARGANIAEFKGHILVEPRRESGVYGLLVQLATLEPELFPFEIVDYDTHAGIDVIAKGRDTIPIQNSSLYYVELKYFFDVQMNHSFDNIRYIVCWDTDVKHEGKVTDISQQERLLNILSPDPENGNYTGYFLRKNFKTDIQIFVLKDYLKEKLGIEFRPRVAPAIK